jgi:hypothetical protein
MSAARSVVSLDDSHERPGGEIAPERRIWRAVIANAFADLTSPCVTNSRLKDQVKEEARQWLTTDSQGLRIACDHAGLASETVMRRAREMLGA